MVSSSRRPDVPVTNANEVEHRRQLAMRANACLAKDGTDGMQAPLALMSYATADLPDPTLNGGAVVYVTDGPALAFSDGATWQQLVTPAPPITVEGTWTPDLRFGGAAVGITYSSRGGQYLKIGNLVHVTGYIILTSKGSSVGSAAFAGLPYETGVGEAAAGTIGMSFYADLASDSWGLYGHIDPEDDRVKPFGTIDAGTDTQRLVDTDFSNTTEVYFGGSYLAAT